MITRLYEQEEYHNFIQLTALFIYAEWMEICEYIHIYDNESGEWYGRRIFWYIVLGTPSILFIAIMALAALKYLWN